MTRSGEWLSKIWGILGVKQYDLPLAALCIGAYTVGMCRHSVMGRSGGILGKEGKKKGNKKSSNTNNNNVKI